MNDNSPPVWSRQKWMVSLDSALNSVQENTSFKMVYHGLTIFKDRIKLMYIIWPSCLRFEILWTITRFSVKFCIRKYYFQKRLLWSNMLWRQNNLASLCEIWDIVNDNSPPVWSRQKWMVSLDSALNSVQENTSFKNLHRGLLCFKDRIISLLCARSEILWTITRHTFGVDKNEWYH